MGHTSPNLALAVYARVMNRRDGEHERLRTLVQGSDLASEHVLDPGVRQDSKQQAA